MLNRVADLPHFSQAGKHLFASRNDLLLIQNTTEQDITVCVDLPLQSCLIPNIVGILSMRPAEVRGNFNLLDPC